MSHSEWDNDHNLDLYNKTAISAFISHCTTVGLDRCCDLDIIYENYIKHSSSVLEVGAGYGRVLQYLLDVHYSGKIIAVERNPKLFEYLKIQFGKYVDLHCKDIKKFTLDSPTDVIVSFWSGFSEFNYHEQLELLKKLRSFMHVSSVLLIDVLDIVEYLQRGIPMSQETVVKIQGNCFEFFPTIKEVKEYSAVINLRVIDTISYTTTKNVHRIIFVLMIKN